MDLEYSEESPGRIAAFGDHYERELKRGHVWKTLSEARKNTERGAWISEVRFLGRTVFYTAVSIRLIRCTAGMIVGTWNELHLIEKAK